MTTFSLNVKKRQSSQDNQNYSSFFSKILCGQEIGFEENGRTQIDDITKIGGRGVQKADPSLRGLKEGSEVEQGQSQNLALLALSCNPRRARAGRNRPWKAEAGAGTKQQRQLLPWWARNDPASPLLLQVSHLPSLPIGQVCPRPEAGSLRKLIHCRAEEGGRSHVWANSTDWPSIFQ